MAYRAVAFDMDGLILDTEVIYNQVGLRLMASHGVTYPAELRRAIMGRRPLDCFTEMIRWHALRNVTPVRLEAESNAIFMQLVKEQGAALMPGFAALIDVLESCGVRRCICTSASRPLMEASLAPEVARRFEFVVTAEDIVHGKPDPEIYRLAAARLGITPSEMVVLEDSQNGCLAGHAAGAMTVAVVAPHCEGQMYTDADLITDRLDSTELLSLFAK